MMSRNIVRKLIPDILLNKYRAFIKSKRARVIEQRLIDGDVITQAMIENDIRNCGINEGDTVLVHSSLSKVGCVEGGAKTIVNAFINVIGTKGNLLMPTSPNSGLQLNYIKKLDFFDVLNDSSNLGSVSEYFRKIPNCERSAHPTEPVSCIGPDANFFTKDHFGQQTPYDSNSPFYRIVEREGKIVYLGVTLENAGTNLHTLEDAVEEFKYPVYLDELFEVSVKFPNGQVKTMKTKVHNPQQSKKRRCDDLIPLFKKRGSLKEKKIGEARTLIVDAKLMFQQMLNEYNEKGVTMYTPKGDK